MPVPTSLVGCATEPVDQDVDARWTMAFAAAIHDPSPRYFDTRVPDAMVAHPLFAVCVEWPAVTAARRLVDQTVLTRAEASRGVHATHDLTLHRLIQPDDHLTTVATVESVAPRRPGAYQVLRLDTTDRRGRLVCTTRMGSLFLGVEVQGPERDAGSPGWQAPEVHAPEVVSHEVRANAAHVYTECSRIWNPIHTDVAVAEAAGLPGPILHGTAVLARAVSDVVERAAAGDPERVQRVCARFGAMVLMPSRLSVELAPAEDASSIGFTVRTTDGAAAVRDGLVVLAP